MSTLDWVVPWLVAMLFIGVFGLAVQQLLLRWNQGQDLRQALITIAVSVIIADQVIAHFPRTVPLGTRSSAGTPSASPGRAGRAGSSTCTSQA